VQEVLVTLAAICVRTPETASITWIDRISAGVAVAATMNKAIGMYHSRQKQQQQQADSMQGLAGPETLLELVLPVWLQPVQDLQAVQEAAAAAAASSADASCDAGDVIAKTQSSLQHVSQAAAGAVQAMAWFSKALAMQRHDGWQQCLRVLVQLLGVLPLPSTTPPSLSAEAAMADEGFDEVLWAAADYFDVLVTPTVRDPAAAAAAGDAADSLGGTAGGVMCSWGNSSGISTSQSQLSVVLQQLEAGTGGAAAAGSLLCAHLMARPLWQQKAFTVALQALQAALQPTAAASAAASHSLTAQQGPAGGALLVAAASLLTAAPAAVIAGEQEAVLPLLVRCLLQLLKLWHTKHKSGRGAEADASLPRLLQLTHSCVLLLGSMFATATGGAMDWLQLHVEQVLGVLCDLVQLIPAKHMPASSAPSAQPDLPTNNDDCVDKAVAFSQQHQETLAAQQQQQVVVVAASIREQALVCLSTCMSLPYHLLHPHRRAVLAVVTAALDDDRRVVRRAAVSCRSKWTIN
jgi:hypothetical protein